MWAMFVTALGIPYAENRVSVYTVVRHMPGKYNPFRPDKIAPPGIFAGRIDELRLIDHCLLQTKQGNPQHFLIEGERGIGKSSLFLCEYMVAEGRIATLDARIKLDFIVVNISLQEKDDYFSITKKIISELQIQIGQRKAFQSFALKAWEFISRVEARGFKFNRDERKSDESELFGTLATDFVKLISNLDGVADGVLLLIDEADKPLPEANLGLLCKSLTEELSRRGCDRLCIGLAGLPDIIQVLRESHESSPRIFKTMSLKALEEHEREMVIDRGLTEQ
jgi:hypothetical protein